MTRESPDQWAERIAAAMPPMTDAEAASVGRLAAAVDARRAVPAQAEAVADAGT